jgi:transcriptional regulator GlxA family with amidase domain
MKRTTLALLLLTTAFSAFAADLKPPAKGRIRVAFTITAGATMADFAGPWEVFQDVHIEGRGQSMEDAMPFELYTVGDERKPVRVSGGMQITPDYTFDDAPVPHVIIVPAQRGSAKLHAWLKAMYPKVDVLASVCVGSFQLAGAGLLDGKEATTHPDYYAALAERFPKVKLVRSERSRWVQSDAVIATAGGVFSGIDLAVHIVERYFGKEVAARTVKYMEYESDGWTRGPATAKAALEQ